MSNIKGETIINLSFWAGILNTLMFKGISKNGHKL